jgi:Family of unknown function (DUF5372)
MAYRTSPRPYSGSGCGADVVRRAPERDSGTRAESNQSGAPREGSARQSTTAGPVDPPLIRITHPFHPLRGQTFRFVVAKSLWGEDRVTFEGADGYCHSVPVGWTDAVPADPHLSVGRGRAYFRVEDLRALATLVAGATRGLERG